MPELGWPDLLGFDYTLITFIIKALTFTMMIIIIKVCELTKSGETPTPNPCEPP